MAASLRKQGNELASCIVPLCCEQRTNTHFMTSEKQKQSADNTEDIPLSVTAA